MYLTSHFSSRITTRPLTASDALIWQRYFDDEEILEIFPNPDGLSSEQRANYWVGRQLERYREHGFGLQALILNATGEFIGQCGLLSQDVNGKMEIEIGYHIFKEHRGNGYAPEAAKLFLDYAREHKIAPSIVSIIHVNNLKSVRVAEKNGFTNDGETHYMGKPVFIYRIS